MNQTTNAPERTPLSETPGDATSEKLDYVAGELEKYPNLYARTVRALAAEVAALEQERDELRKLLFVDRDEWRRFRVHGDTVLALEAKHAEVERLRAAIREHVSLRLCDCIQDESCVACRTQANLDRALTKPEVER